MWECMLVSILLTDNYKHTCPIVSSQLTVIKCENRYSFYEMTESKSKFCNFWKVDFLQTLQVTHGSLPADKKAISREIKPDFADDYSTHFLWFHIKRCEAGKTFETKASSFLTVLMLDYREKQVPELQQSKTQCSLFCALPDMPLWKHEKHEGKGKTFKW